MLVSVIVPFDKEQVPWNLPLLNISASRKSTTTKMAGAAGGLTSASAWASVREDYSADGDAWGYLPHDLAQ